MCVYVCGYHWCGWCVGVCGYDGCVSCDGRLSYRLMTIGYGDIVPRQLIFGAFYVLVGVALISGAIGIVATHALEYQEKLLAEKSKIASAKMRKLAKRAAARRLSHNTTEAVVLAADVKIDKRLYDDELRDIIQSSIGLVVVVFILILVGAAVVGAIEGWTYDVAFYWACVTITSIGMAINATVMHCVAQVSLHHLSHVRSLHVGSSGRLICCIFHSSNSVDH
jgi:Ion channel